MRTWVVVLAALALGGCATTKAESPQPAAPVETESQGPVISPERADKIERVFARKAQELQACWTEEYEKSHNRKLEGDVTIQLNVAPSGQANDVRVIKSSLGSPEIESCVTKTVAGWDFPSGEATVPYSRTVHIGAQY
jgi:TonB family protein